MAVITNNQESAIVVKFGPIETRIEVGETKEVELIKDTTFFLQYAVDLPAGEDVE